MRDFLIGARLIALGMGIIVDRCYDIFLIGLSGVVAFLFFVMAIGSPVLLVGSVLLALFE
jgi:hypothetical protein